MNKLWIIAGIGIVSILASSCRPIGDTGRASLGVCIKAENRNLYMAAPADFPRRCLPGDQFVSFTDNPDTSYMCWDVNGNGAPDLEEDSNGDMVFDTRDCKGGRGEQGERGAQVAEVLVLGSSHPELITEPSVSVEEIEAGYGNLRTYFIFPRGEKGPARPANTVCLAGTSDSVTVPPSSISGYCNERCPNGVVLERSQRTNGGTRCEAIADVGRCTSNHASFHNFCCVCKP